MRETPGIASLRSWTRLPKSAGPGSRMNPVMFPPGRARLGTTPAATLLTSNIDVLYASALAGLGIAGLPTFVVEQALRDGRLERVLPQWRGIHLSLYAAMPTRKHVPIRTRALIDYLVQIFGGTDRDPWLIGES